MLVTVNRCNSIDGSSSHHVNDILEVRRRHWKKYAVLQFTVLICYDNFILHISSEIFSTNIAQDSSNFFSRQLLVLCEFSTTSVAK